MGIAGRIRAWMLLLWPPSWFVLLSSAKDFSAHPVLGNPILNAAGLHVWRRALADWICNVRRRQLRKLVSTELADQWDQLGMVRIDNFMGPEVWAAVCDELSHAALPMIEMVQPPALTRRANLDAHTCRGRYPALLVLLQDATLRRLLHYVAGYRGSPVIALQCIHSGSPDTQGGHDPQTEWHSDTFHSSAKAWLFLHAVGVEGGPFAYIPGSHRLTRERLAWEKVQSTAAASHSHPLHAKGSLRVSDAELAAMGYGAPLVGVVPANTLVVADTGGFHRRCPSTAATVRVEIYCSLRRNPFLAGLYPSVLGLPWIRENWASCLFALYTWMHVRGVPSWDPRGTPGLNEIEKQALVKAPE